MDPAKMQHIIYSGLYEFKKFCFGLVNVPATFQRLMKIVWIGKEWMNGVSG